MGITKLIAIQKKSALYKPVTRRYYSDCVRAPRVVPVAPRQLGKPGSFVAAGQLANRFAPGCPTDWRLMESSLPAIPRTKTGNPASRHVPMVRILTDNLFSSSHARKAMRLKLAASALAFLLFLPHLFARESAPVIKLAVAPKYPTLTLAGRVYGEVVVRVTINRAGTVEDTEVMEGHPMLRESAVDAAQQWKFEASSVPKRVGTLTFSFVILPPSSKVESQTVFLPPCGFEIRERPVEPAQPAVDSKEGEDRPPQDTISKT
jgi:TonB family protein